MINPAEYYYLTKPLLANGSAMIKYTLQDLCIRNILHVEQRWIYLHSNAQKQRLRFFFSHGTEFFNYTPSNTYEEFILKPFQNNTELRFYKIRKYVKKELKGDPLEYKREYVYPELRKQKLCNFRVFVSKEGKSTRNQITDSLLFIEDSVDILIKENRPLLISKLEELESNILFLSKECIDKLDMISEDIAKISKLAFLSKFESGFNSFDVFFAMDSFGGADGFEGFDGGDFGGGGAGGDW